MKYALGCVLTFALNERQRICEAREKRHAEVIEAIRADHQNRSKPGASIPARTMRVHFGE